MSFDIQTSKLTETAIRHLMTRVRKIAFRMKQRLPAHVDVNDMISAGYLGLTQSFANFGSSDPGAFEAYAIQRATGAMLDELRNNDQLPRSARRLAAELVSAESRLANELGRKPESEEIATALGMSPASLMAARVRTERYEAVGLGAVEIAPHANGSFEEPEHALERCQREQKLQAGMDKLPERLRNILQMCHDEGLTLREIGEKLGVTEARVCQLRKEAVQRLRHHCKDTVLPPPAPSYECAA